MAYGEFIHLEIGDFVTWSSLPKNALPGFINLLQNRYLTPHGKGPFRVFEKHLSKHPFANRRDPAQWFYRLENPIREDNELKARIFSSGWLEKVNP